MTLDLSIVPHPLLDAGAFTTELSQDLGSIVSPLWLVELLRLEASAPLRPSDEVRGAIRDLLRHGGYKPTGRGKPASEYLLRAAGDGSLKPINSLVDTCNAVSLHSGLPISVVDLGLAPAPHSIRIAGPAERYAFNPAGQVLDLEGLLCLYDAQGPCGNAVKDAQRTKTHAATRRTLSIVWGTTALPQRTAETVAWYQDLLKRQQIFTETVAIAR